jgi:hypothetical protein
MAWLIASIPATGSRRGSIVGWRSRSAAKSDGGALGDHERARSMAAASDSPRWRSRRTRATRATASPS